MWAGSWEKQVCYLPSQTSHELVSKSCLRHSSICWECRSAFAFQQVFPNLSNGSNNDSLPLNVCEVLVYTRNRTALNTIVPVILIIYKLNLWGLSYWQTCLSRRYGMKSIVNQILGFITWRKKGMLIVGLFSSQFFTEMEKSPHLLFEEIACFWMTISHALYFNSVGLVNLCRYLCKCYIFREATNRQSFETGMLQYTAAKHSAGVWRDRFSYLIKKQTNRNSWDI